MAEAAPQPAADTGTADVLPPAVEAAAPDHDEPAQEPAPETAAVSTPEPLQASVLEPEPVLDLADDFDLDLNGDELPATAAQEQEPESAFTAGPTAALPALAQDDAFDLDLDIDQPAPVDAALHGESADTQPALQPDPLADIPAAEGPLPEPADHRFDGRREPTLDIPDEHLAAVALHDSFELDAYPHQHDQHDQHGQELHSAGEHGHTLDTGVWRSRDDTHHFGDEPAAIGAHAVDSLASEDAPATASAMHDDDGDDDIVTLSSAAGAKLAPEPSAPATPVSAREPEEPGFVKRSRRQEQWGKASRIAMACATPLLLAGLAYQAVATFRNPLAAAVPALKPALVSACAIVGCKVELPSQLDALSIEQGELQTMADNIFSFSTSLRNQSATAQNWPHIELILNDSADKPVLRRVFAPRDYLPPNADFASGFLPRSEQPVKLYFELSRVKASGYHIAVFYP
ncbi:hypothetical protein GCM10027277_17960 [Pseudoduganella ginsengisoli]